MSQPLSGIRVLDLSRVLAGPWATQLLADLGAEVIKIERPGEGDDTRGWGPPFLQPDGELPAESAYFLCANRGKKSVAVDLGTPEGARVIRELAGSCDVFIENFKVGGLRKYGLDAESLQALNPGLVYCSITGYGQTGPYASRPGYDFVIQGSAGLMSVTGTPDSGPVKAGVAIVDILTGLYAANAIQAALIERGRTGLGRRIDMALQDVLVAVMANQASNYLVSGKNPGLLGNAHPNIVPYQAFATRDGMLTVAVGNDGQFRRFCGALEIADAADDPMFLTNQLRVANRDRLVPLLADIFRCRPTAEWLARLDAAGVPSGPVNTMADVFADDQVKSRELQTTLSHASLGAVPGVRCPIRFGNEDLSTRMGPPVLGQHTGEVLAGMGISNAQIEDWKRDGTIQVVPGG